VQKEKANEAIHAIYAEIEKLKNNPPKPQELETLKNYLFGKIQSGMDSLFSIASMYKNLLLDGREIDFIEGYVDAIKTIEPQIISDMIAKYVDDVEKVEMIVS
jgi:predicted Zn-dependent peptidase